ncbi:MAG: 5'-methylthioadenosine/S-adenosylhomocysteine nucleosidase [Rhodoferax sp.]
MLLVAAALPVRAAARFDATPRIAIVSAFGAELELLQAQMQARRSYRANGVVFTTGRLRGKAVVAMLCGVSMVNAAMNTQLLLERFRVTHLLVSGIAGGVNPALPIGDVTVAQRWGQYLEVLLARESAPGQYALPPWSTDSGLPHNGMQYTRPVRVLRAGLEQPESKFWFETDPTLLERARSLSGLALARCADAEHCLAHQPQLVVGGNGVSGQAFVDNAAFREYVHSAFQADLLDMESAAIAHVAHSNGVPFIAFRSLSDLAGGGAGANEIELFFQVAADNAAATVLAFLAAWK